MDFFARSLAPVCQWLSVSQRRMIACPWLIAWGDLTRLWVDGNSLEVLARLRYCELDLPKQWDV